MFKVAILNPPRFSSCGMLRHRWCGSSTCTANVVLNTQCSDPCFLCSPQGQQELEIIADCIVREDTECARHRSPLNHTANTQVTNPFILTLTGNIEFPLRLPDTGLDRGWTQEAPWRTARATSQTRIGAAKSTPGSFKVEEPQSAARWFHFMFAISIISKVSMEMYPLKYIQKLDIALILCHSPPSLSGCLPRSGCCSGCNRECECNSFTLDSSYLHYFLLWCIQLLLACNISSNLKLWHFWTGAGNANNIHCIFRVIKTNKKKKNSHRHVLW